MSTSLARVSSRSDRRPLLDAGVAFLEGSASSRWGIEDLRDWMASHLVVRGIMSMPMLVSEPSAGTVPLRGAPVHPRSLRLIVVAARCRVLTALRGLVATPADDRFLSASIFAGRVTRGSVGGISCWVPTPDSATPLSGIVLSLFAADALAHRDTYADLFDECDQCGQMTFHGGGASACLEHELKESGFFPRTRA
jgi:hypothetical protein